MRYVYVILLCLSTLTVSAQGDAVISQYVLQPYLFNPAAAGSEEMMQVGAQYRNQWGGIEGAPQNFMVQFNNSTNKNNIGYGAWLGRDTWGPYAKNEVFGTFSYRIKAGKGHLSIGIQAGLQNFNTSWNELSAYQAGDVTFTGSPGENVFIPNFGAGVMYKNKRLSAGIGIPHMLSGKVFEDRNITQVNYYNAHFNYRMLLDKKVGIVPAILVKWTKNTAQVDLNLYAVILQKIWVGAGFRSDKSANFNVQYHLIAGNNQFKLGYAYDLANGTYRSATGSGSHEIMLVYQRQHKAVNVTITPVF
jgi:type IX secretion system PorP/SprF family membrane protein